MITELTHQIESAGDGRVATEEHRGVVGGVGLQASVGSTVGIVLGRPREGRGFEARLLQTLSERIEPGLGEIDGGAHDERLALDHELHPTVAVDEIAQLPLAGHLGRQAGDRDILDQHAEDLLAELLGEQKLGQAPLRIDPRSRDEKDHGFAAMRGQAKRLLPPFAGNETARLGNVEKILVPAVFLEPLAEGERVRVVRARMADEDERHGLPEGSTS